MEFTLTSFRRATKSVGQMKISPERLAQGELEGTISLEVPEEGNLVYEYILDNAQDVLVDPYVFAVNNSDEEHEISIRITGPDPKFSLKPGDVPKETELPTYRFYLPTIEELNYTQRFVKRGLTDGLKEEIEANYDHNRSPFLGFISRAKRCLDYDQYISLLNAVASVDNQVRNDLSNTRQKFFKNIICGKKAGKQYPIRSHEELSSKVSTYERHENLNSPDIVSIVHELINEASEHDTYIDEVCSLEKTFAEVAPDLGTGYFINILSESLLSEFDIGTEERIFKNSFKLSAQKLVKSRYNSCTVTGTFEELNQTAYDSELIKHREKALAASLNSNSEEFYQAIAELLYWYAESRQQLPKEIQPQVYATAAKLYEKSGIEFQASAAAYRASVSEGKYLRQNGQFDDARKEFFSAITLADGQEKGPFDEIEAFVESVRTDIEEYRRDGEYKEASEEARYGYEELSEGKYEDHDTPKSETLFKAWEEDMLAQHQAKQGDLQAAIETTENAIGKFRKYEENKQENKPAITAQARRYQLQALQAQLELDFETAADHHKSAKKEAGKVSKDTEHFHEVQINLCTVKQHLLECMDKEQLPEARIKKAMDELREYDSDEANINNLRVLVNTYEDYRKENRKERHSTIEEVIERLEIEDIEKSGDRHISFSENYVLAVIYVVAAQRLARKGLSQPILQHTMHAAIKSAISGGVSPEWTEVSELSNINPESHWKSVIPSVTQREVTTIELETEKKIGSDHSSIGMNLLSTLEGYLRVIVEYYSKLEHNDQWRDEITVEKKGNKPTLGDIYTFFNSDDAAEMINSKEKILSKLEKEDYSDKGRNIRDIRNDLIHSNVTNISEELFDNLKSRVFTIMRISADDCPVIAEVEETDGQYEEQVASCQLQWNQVPRRIEIRTQKDLSRNQKIYLPPDIEIDPTIVPIDGKKIKQAEMVPETAEEYLP